ncbi:MAG: tRNA dihydrouridine synthase DusB [Candidatus Omnitrophota bacterium]
MLKIGSLNLKKQFILAPMAGISDLAFRIFNRQYGCELAFSEMINVRSLGYKSRKTESMLQTTPEDSPFGVQILGCEEEFIKRGLDILNSFSAKGGSASGGNFDILDFNAACPEKKVTRRGEGASLLKEPKKMNRLLRLVVRNSKVPVTVKIRTGWDNSRKAEDIAFYAQDSGIKALFIHGRTKLQGYSGDVDYKTIKKVKDALGIPVIASGDIFSAGLAKKMFDETGCDGILVARGAFGNPWIFKQLDDFLKHGTIGRQLGLVNISDIADAMIEQLNLCTKFNGERTGVVIFRKFFIWYTQGVRNVRRLRNRACLAKTNVDMLSTINEFKKLHL